jgi:ribosomal protein S21
MKGVSKSKADRMVESVTEGNWSGCHVKDMPWVKQKAGGHERSIDEMLNILRRRMAKNGRLAEYKERQYYVKPSQEMHERYRKIEHERNKNK